MMKWKTDRTSLLMWLKCLTSACLLAVTVLPGCGGSGTTTQANRSPMALQATNEAGLTAYFREALGPAGKSYLGSPWALDAVTAISAVAPPAAATSSAAFSTTTLQEAGVDEADLVKTDGVQVFSLDQFDAKDASRNLLRRQRFDAATPSLIPGDSLKLAFSGDVRATGIYLDSKRQQLVVLAEGSGGMGVYPLWFAPQSWGHGVTEVMLVDSAQPGQMQARRTLRISAQLIGSRRLDATLYLVMRSYPHVPGLDPGWSAEKTSANQNLLDSLHASQLLPTLALDGGKAQALVEASACYTQENNSIKSADIITVVAIDLAANTHRHTARCFTGGTEAFYMSDQSLYLATTRNTYTYNGAFPVYAAQTTTDIHKFALNGMDLAYRGSGSVVGHLGFDQNRKSFRMGEYNGMLRVLTQTQETWSGWLAMPASTPTAATSKTIESPGHLSILQEDSGTLAVVGELPNANRPQPLGKSGEQLYASRFIGTRAYLVTYRLTDPLYVLDMSNPSDPRVAGELQVNGYSDYLFPLTDNLLLGVGKDALSDGTAGDGRFAWYQGVQVTLIDVSDQAHPREVARSIIGRRGTDATVLRDHHGIALQTSGNRVRVGLPVSLHDTPPGMPSGLASDYYQFTRTELQRFEIDVAEQSLTRRPALPANSPEQRDISNDRALLWNDQVHYYLNGIWQSAGW